MKKLIYASAWGLVASMCASMVHPYFWWIGMVVGFGGGYISYDWQETREACERVWREYVEKWIAKTGFVWSQQRVDVFRKLVAREIFDMTAMMCAIAGMCSWLIILIAYFTLETSITAELYYFIGGVLVIHIAALIFSLGFALWYILSLRSESTETLERFALVYDWQPWLLSFPVLPLTLLWLVVGFCIPALGRFVRDVAFYILSEGRLIFAVSCAIGAPATFFTGFWWVGAIVAPLSYVALTKLSKRYAIAEQ